MQLLFRSDHSLTRTRTNSGSEQVLAPGPRPHLTPHVGVCRSLLPSDQLTSMSQTDAAPKQGLVGWLRRSWVRRSSRADAGTLQQESGRHQQQPGAKGLATASFKASPTHLIVMVNGLFGSAANWDVICEQLQQHLPPDTLLHPSRVNARFSTYQGIDACGQRLADEVRGVVAAAGPGLTHISIIAHSMGGLMARYAIGALFNPSSSTICGLQPAHFVTMATPHCGCDADGVAQVPFIGWTGDLPLLGQQLYRFLSNISGSTASIIFQRTGQQFFLMDGTTAAAAPAAPPPPTTTAAEQTRGRGAEIDGSIADSSTSHLPLLLQMTQDCPDRGLYFYSALAAFKTRTCYANMDGDHLVGFANSSLRSLDQLPPPPPEARTAKGVVMEDSLSAAFWPHTWHHLQQQWSQAAAGVSQALQGYAAAAGDAGEVQQQGPAAGAATIAAAVSAAAMQAAVSVPYQASRNWYGQARPGPQATRQQQQQAPAPLARAPAAGPASDWHEISRGSSSNSPETSQSSSAQLVSGQTMQQQQQQSPRQMAFAVAALELEAAGALPAATEVVAGVLQQPAAATPSTSAADSGDDLVALTYSSPVSTPSGQQAVSSTDEPGTQQQQQQQPPQGGPASTAAVASAEADLTSGLSGQTGPVAVAESPAEAVADVAADAAQMWAAAAEMGGESANRAALVSHMLKRLQELPWRRIDVSFQGAKFGFAHNNIQVTRRWWNFEGVAVPTHLAQQLQVMNALVLGDAGHQQKQQQQAEEAPLHQQQT